MDNWVVGIDLGATKIALGLINPQNQIVAHRRIPTLVTAGPQAAVERIATSMSELQGEIPDGQQIAALGICSPGPLDHQSGMIIDPPNLTGWRNVPFRQMLSDRLGLPVRLEHDAKAAGLGEFYYGAGRGERSLVYMVVGTGVGAAIIVDGQLMRGGHNSAGEVGHITIDREGELCSCGSRGCVETYASGPGLSRYYDQLRRQAGGVRAGEQPAGGEQITQLAGQGDRLALETITRAGEALGLAIATMAMILDIELYVIGSSVAKAGDLLLEPARRIVPQYSLQSVSRHVRIVTTELWDNGPILGCGWLARQALEERM